MNKVCFFFEVFALLVIYYTRFTMGMYRNKSILLLKSAYYNYSFLEWISINWLYWETEMWVKHHSLNALVEPLVVILWALFTKAIGMYHTNWTSITKHYHVCLLNFIPLHSTSFHFIPLITSFNLVHFSPFTHSLSNVRFNISCSTQNGGEFEFSISENSLTRYTHDTYLYAKIYLLLSSLIFFYFID